MPILKATAAGTLAADTSAVGTLAAAMAVVGTEGTGEPDLRLPRNDGHEATHAGQATLASCHTPS